MKAYFFARDMYWKMPPGLRNTLRGPARPIADTLRDRARKSAIASSSSTDLSLEQFRNNILSQAHAYKGIFVQSVVIDWNVDLFQRPQHMANAFARRGYLVIYQTVNWTKDDIEGFRQVRPHVWVTNCNVINMIPGCVVSFYSTAYADPQALLSADRNTNILVYEYIDHIDPKISGGSQNIAALRDQKNRAFSGGVDFIVASAAALYEEAVAAVGEDKVLLVHNGVDTSHYR